MDLNKISNIYNVRRLEAVDVAKVYELCQANKMYYQYCPPFVTEKSILDDMNALPPGKDGDDKYYIGFFEDDDLVAVMDLVNEFPDKKTAFIGFFMTKVSVQNKGVGSSIIKGLVDYLRNIDTRYIRLGWVEGNPQAEAFWKKNGFSETGITQDTDDYTVVLAERALAIGMMVKGKIDRPLGTAHPNYPDMIYPINYGYVDGVLAGDGEEQDVYVLGSSNPIEDYEGKVIGVYHRTNDNEDKWIVSVDEKDYSNEEILDLIEFQEKYYEGRLIR